MEIILSMFSVYPFVFLYHYRILFLRIYYLNRLLKRFFSLSLFFLNVFDGTGV
jgi:hypothetical protein